MIAVSVFEAVWRHPSGALLAVQLLGLLLYPLMEDTGAGRGLFNTFGVLVLALVLWVVVRSPTANWIAWLLAAPAALLTLLGGWGGSRTGSCGGNCWRARSTSTRPPA
jgi:hypothetical protein